MTGGPMPYVMDKGPYLSVLEDLLNTPARRTQMLTGLRNNEPISNLIGLDSTSLNGDGHDLPYRVAVFNRLWFGMELDASGEWVKQPNLVSTGFWNGYHGDTEAILRAGLIRAIEVSLGLEHGGSPNAATRTWPIEICWVCQGPFFQCWIDWLASPFSTGDGHVAITITTPAAGDMKIEAKITRPTVDPEYASPPALGAQQEARGLWVVGHEDYEQKLTLSTQGTPFGTFPFPMLVWHSPSTDVVCVAPAEWEGGVLAAGRPYT